MRVPLVIASHFTTAETGTGRGDGSGGGLQDPPTASFYVTEGGRMNRIHRIAAALSALTALAAVPSAAQTVRPSFTGTVEVVVDGRVLQEYRAYGTRYVEALKGKEYAIRLHNPFGVRVAVALSVDGLSTIDARHTTAAAARKWVIGPYETITISGWQTSMAKARQFFFTTEDRSYAQRLGQPDNQGVISAVFFRERAPVHAVPLARDDAAEDTRRQRPAAAGAAAKAESLAGRAAEEYAATGIGEHTDHPVEIVHLDLEANPAATIDIRYEYRSQLVRLGIVPNAPAADDPLSRRQHAQGFDKRFCPDIR
jgi:hypothetical protein